MYISDRYSSLHWLQIVIMATMSMIVAADIVLARDAVLRSHIPKPSAATVIPIAIFGKDDRQDLPQAFYSLRQSIGLVYNNRARSVCSGFCVADNVIATAAHCLFRTEGEQRPRLRQFKFALKAAKRKPETPIEGYRTYNPSQFVIAGSRNLRVIPPIEATKDWALMRLQKPICKNAALALADTGMEGKGLEHDAVTLEQVSFHNDVSNWRLTYSGPCRAIIPGKQVSKQQVDRDFTGSVGLVLHSCDTGGASSGSPIFQRGPDNEFRVVAINVGTYVQTKVLTQGGRVVQRYQPNAIANTAVAASKIRVFLPYFSQADIIESPAALRLLQTALQSRGFYNDRIDGSFGPATRLAIQTYRATPDLELVGLPTTKLLTRLLPEVDLARLNTTAQTQVKLPKPKVSSTETETEQDWRQIFDPDK